VASAERRADPVEHCCDLRELGGELEAQVSRYSPCPAPHLYVDPVASRYAQHLASRLAEHAAHEAALEEVTCFDIEHGDSVHDDEPGILARDVQLDHVTGSDLHRDRTFSHLISFLVYVQLELGVYQQFPA